MGRDMDASWTTRESQPALEFELRQISCQTVPPITKVSFRRALSQAKLASVEPNASALKMNVSPSEQLISSMKTCLEFFLPSARAFRQRDGATR
jgi:hypothetical protein